MEKITEFFFNESSDHEDYQDWATSGGESLWGEFVVFGGDVEWTLQEGDIQEVVVDVFPENLADGHYLALVVFHTESDMVTDDPYPIYQSFLHVDILEIVVASGDPLEALYGTLTCGYVEPIPELDLPF